LHLGGKAGWQFSGLSGNVAKDSILAFEMSAGTGPVSR
jgi:hypothetical protein